MSEILRINNLWGGYREGVDILRGITLSMEAGESVGIIGLNGSGKSTLGKAIMNMIPIRRGDIFFSGENITALTTTEISLKKIAFMQQGGQVFQTLSVWENISVALLNHSGVSFNDLQSIIPILSQSKSVLQRLSADKLSGGQKHQLALAMSLATNPCLLILDEPSAGLSPKSVAEMYSILSTVKRKLGIAIILIEQNVVKAMEFCDRTHLISQGGIAGTYTSKDIQNIQSLMFD